jgi:uncharacterized protein (TIGR03083 family)
MIQGATTDSATTKAARLLLLEAAAIEPILQSLAGDQFELPTVCDGWSVRDVLAHCGAALTRTATGDLHTFSAEENQTDVEDRRDRPIADVVEELINGYLSAAAVIEGADGTLDGIALGEWMHGGDVRDALSLPGAYASEGIGLALELLVERSRRMGKPAVEVNLPDRSLDFGSGAAMGALTTDVETFVRICGGRRPDPGRYTIDGDVDIADLVLFP